MSSFKIYANCFTSFQNLHELLTFDNQTNLELLNCIHIDSNWSSFSMHMQEVGKWPYPQAYGSLNY